MTKSALIDVENTEGILEFAEYLASAGWRILSANKTEELFKQKKIPVVHESSFSKSGIYVNDASLLIKDIIEVKSEDDENTYQKYNDYNKNYIKIVCLNVLPTLNKNLKKNQLKDAIKPVNFLITSILRNVISNYENLLILTDPADYKEAMIQLKTSHVTMEFKSYLAAKALNLISAYDAGIATSVLQSDIYKEKFMNYLTYPLKKDMVLHDGLNNHQEACIYKFPADTGVLNGITKAQGKEISYSIFSDVSLVWGLISTLFRNLKNQMSVKSINSDGYEFTTQFTPLTGTVCTIAVKLSLIVGASLSTNVIDSFRKTYSYDRENINDVVLGCSAVIDGTAAKEIVNCSFIAVVAPGFTDEAKEIFATNTNIRLIPTGKIEPSEYNGHFISNGLLLQTRDSSLFKKWNIKTKNRPSQNITDEMAFGTLLSLGARSYSALLLKNNRILTISQGCVSMKQAITNLIQEAPERTDENESVADILVADSPIPLCQSVMNLIELGVKAIIQPGGTPTDDEFIKYCDDHEVIMIFTNMTHIKN